MAKEKYNYSTLTIISQQFNQQLEEVRSQLEAERADRAQLEAELDRTRAELAELQENPPPATPRQPAPAIDLPEQVPQIINFLKELLPPDTKWPKRVLPKLRQFLESKED